MGRDRWTRPASPKGIGSGHGAAIFTWLDSRPGHKIYDISRLVASDAQHPAFGPENTFHWWGEPQLGYYASDDDFVIERHAQMLSDAGVDVIVCDATNGFTYDPTVSEGGKTRVALALTDELVVQLGELGRCHRRARHA